MQLDFGFLAQNAGLLSDGLITVYGGNLDTIQASRFPTPPISFSLVAWLSILPHEPLEGHHLRIEIIAGNGERRPLSNDREVAIARNPRLPEEPGRTMLIVNLMIPFSGPGRRTLILMLDNQDALSLPIFVTQSEGE